MKHIKLLLLIAATIILTACGGGGSSNPGTDAPPANKLPVANAGSDKTVQVNQSVTITGTGTDSDGKIVSYQWKKGSKVLASMASFSYTPTVVGADTLTFTVTDNDGATASDSMKVTVNVPTHKGNISLLYDNHSNIAKIKWDENTYQDIDGYVVQKQELANRSLNGSWIEIRRFLPGSGNYLIQDNTVVSSTYRIVSISDSGLLSGDNGNTKLSVNPSIKSSIYFTQDDVNVTMPLNRVVTVHTQTDDPNIEKVIYYMDTVRIGESNKKPNFPLTLHTTSYSDGMHRLDNELKISDSSYIRFNNLINIYNTNLSLTLSLQGETGLVPVVAYATSKEDIQSVKFYLDSVLVADVKDKNYCLGSYRCNPYNSYMWEWDLTSYIPNTTYTIKAEVSDASGQSLSRELVYTVNTPPVLQIDSPINDSIVGNTLTISGITSDDENDTTTTITVGNQVIYSDNNNRFFTTYDMSGLPDKYYSITIKATDPTGNSTVEYRRFLYQADSNHTPYKVVTDVNDLLNIKNGYLLYRHTVNDLHRLVLDTDVHTQYDLGKTKNYHYLDVNRHGNMIFTAEKYDPKSYNQVFLIDQNISDLGVGSPAILNDNYALWFGYKEVPGNLFLYSLNDATTDIIDLPENSRYWDRSASWYINNEYLFTSVRKTIPNHSAFVQNDLYVYEFNTQNLVQITDTPGWISEEMIGVNDKRILYFRDEKDNSGKWSHPLYYTHMDDYAIVKKLSNDYKDPGITDGFIAWVEKIDNSLYTLKDSETTPVVIAQDVTMGKMGEGVLTYVKDGKIYLYQNFISKEIWLFNDEHYIDNGYIYIVRDGGKLIYRILL